MTKKKHAGGRPPKYKTVEELQEKIEEYFDFCDNKTKKIYSEKLGEMMVADPEPYTMSGLAYALNLSRQGLVEYKEKDQFSDAIKRARDRVEKDLDRRLNDKALFTPGLIFNLKNNFNWREKTETDLTSGGDKVVSFTYIAPNGNSSNDNSTT